MKFIGQTIFYAFVFCASALVDAFIICKLWGWFVMPFGLPAIGQGHALGMRLVGTMLTGSHDKTEKAKKAWKEQFGREAKNWEVTLTIFGGDLLRALVFWALGAYFHAHMTRLW